MVQAQQIQRAHTVVLLGYGAGFVSLNLRHNTHGHFDPLGQSAERTAQAVKCDVRQARDFESPGVVRPCVLQPATRRARTGEDVGVLWSARERVTAELRRWQSMQPQTVTEAALHDAKLKELGAELSAVEDRIRSLEGEQAPSLPQVAAALILQCDHRPSSHAHSAIH
jgi:hypothetical protein